MVGHICHSLKQTENNVKVEELFEDDANYTEPEEPYDKLNDFNEESVQLKVGLINKSPMGVHALYWNSWVLPNIWSEQSACTSLNKNDVTHLNLL